MTLSENLNQWKISERELNSQYYDISFDAEMPARYFCWSFQNFRWQQVAKTGDCQNILDFLDAQKRTLCQIVPRKQILKYFHRQQCTIIFGQKEEIFHSERTVPLVLKCFNLNHIWKIKIGRGQTFQIFHSLNLPYSPFQIFYHRKLAFGSFQMQQHLRLQYYCLKHP